jgi:L-amino acid N-acyltransferase YncA
VIAGSGTQARIALRRATGDDSELLWLWRNDPVMRAMAKTAAPITWEEHARWFQRVIDDRQTELYIAELAGSSAAMVRFDRQDNRALVSINVSPAHRGKGIGSVALAAACEDYCRRNAQQDLVAEIRHSNDPSKGAFRSAGFVESSSDSEFVTWSRPARDGERSSTE